MRPAQALVESRRRRRREGFFFVGVGEVKEEGKEEARSSSSLKASCLPGASSAVAACLKSTRWRVPIEVVVGWGERGRGRGRGEEKEKVVRRLKGNKKRMPLALQSACGSPRRSRGAFGAFLHSDDRMQGHKEFYASRREGRTTKAEKLAARGALEHGQWRPNVAFLFSLLSPATPRSRFPPAPAAAVSAPLRQLFACSCASSRFPAAA